MWQNKIFIEHCAVFSLATSSSIQGHITDATVAIFKYHGVDEVKKWVDDFVFFCTPNPPPIPPDPSQPTFSYCIDLLTVMRRDGDRERTEVPDVRQGLGFSLCVAPPDAYCPRILGMGLEVWTMSSRDNQCRFQTGEHT